MFLSRLAHGHQTCRSFSTSSLLLAGHNKWSKIKQKKGVMDARKGAIYGKANRDIVVAVRNGGSDDPEKNVALAAVLKRVKSQGVPKENIEAAVAKAMKSKDHGGQYLVYEALAFNTVGFIIECLTDNTNRTIHNIRGILDSHSARFAPVNYLFQREGCIRVAVTPGESGSELEGILDAALEAGASDFHEIQGSEANQVVFTCPTQELASVTDAVSNCQPSCELLSSELIYSPKEHDTAVDDETREKVSLLVGDLEEDDDTLRVWTSLDSVFVANDAES
ncbi:hypothetical protein ONZ45_g8143 [Pleurotus djamor]|nr:hypothetical protein ONZ45_g8143 [Pleurotus djamor]